MIVRKIYLGTFPVFRAYRNGKLMVFGFYEDNSGGNGGGNGGGDGGGNSGGGSGAWLVIFFEDLVIEISSLAKNLHSAEALVIDNLSILETYEFNAYASSQVFRAASGKSSTEIKTGTSFVIRAFLAAVMRAAKAKIISYTTAVGYSFSSVILTRLHSGSFSHTTTNAYSPPIVRVAGEATMSDIKALIELPSLLSALPCAGENNFITYGSLDFRINEAVRIGMVKSESFSNATATLSLFLFKPTVQDGVLEIYSAYNASVTDGILEVI